MVMNALMQGASIIQGIRSGKSSARQAERAARDQFKYNLALQKDAQNYNTWMYQNRFQMQRKDLEDAGINPLFGMGQAPTVTSGQNSIGMPEYVAEQNARAQQAMQLLDFGSNLSAKAADTKLKEAQAATESINTNMRLMETQGQMLDNLLKKKELTWYDKKTIQELQESMSRTQLNIETAQTQEIERASLRAGIGLTNTQARRMRLENAPYERNEQWIRKHPVIGKLTEGTKNNISALTGIAGLLGGGLIGASGIVKGRLHKRKVGF